MNPRLTPYATTVLQDALRALKEGGPEQWVTGMATDGAGRYCAAGRIVALDPRRSIHGVSPAHVQIAWTLHQYNLPQLSYVNDGHRAFNYQTGYEGVIALMDHLLIVAGTPTREPVEVVS